MKRGAKCEKETATKAKRYAGEEAERVTWVDCRAANEIAAKMLAGQVDPMTLVVEAPKRVIAIVKD